MFSTDVLRDTILRSLDGMASKDGVIQADPATATDAVVAALAPAMNGLDKVRFTTADDPAQTEPYMVCDDCGEVLCTIEEGDTLGVIVSVAQDHRKEKHA